MKWKLKISASAPIAAPAAVNAGRPRSTAPVAEPKPAAPAPAQSAGSIPVIGAHAGDGSVHCRFCRQQGKSGVAVYT